MASRIFKAPPVLTPNAESLAIASKNQINSPFLCLPAEIRNHIYALELDLDSGLFSSDSMFHYDHFNWDRLELARTCHQIFTETAFAYFRAKIAPLCSKDGVSLPSDTDTIVSIFSKLTPSQKASITNVHIFGNHMQVWTRPTPRPFLDLPNLKVIALERWSISRSVFGLGDWEHHGDAWRRWTRQKTLLLTYSRSGQEPLRLY